MPVLNPCENCGRPTPIYRLAGVILDGRIARLCPRCVASETERIETPYAPRTDNGAIQPSTPRETW
jgi:NMD protein affecting ribosome stability and mRNA decay